jgi:hypothetical protein
MTIANFEEEGPASYLAMKRSDHGKVIDLA